MQTTDDRTPIHATVLDHFSQRIGGDVARYLLSVAIPSLMTIAFITIFTRVFDTVQYGRYTVVFVTCTIVTPLWSGWVSQALLRYLPRFRARDETAEFKSMLSALLVALLLLLAVVLALVYPLVRPSLGAYEPYYVPAAVLVVAGVAYHVLRALFQANLQSGAYARSEILFSVGRIAFSLAFVFLFWRDAVGLIVGPAVSYTLLVAAMVPWHRLPAAVRAYPHAFRLTLAPQFLRYGMPLIGWMIGVRILEMSDRYLIHYLRGPGEVGVYSANYGMASMAIWIVATPLLLTAHPLIFSSWESGGRQRVQELVTLFSRYYLLAMAPLAALVVVFARDLAAVLLGESFRDGYTVVPVVFAGLLLWNFGFYGHKSLKVLEKTRVMLAMVCVCVVVNVGVNLILIPRYGYMGAAIGTLIAAGMYPVMVFAVTRRLLAWRIPWRSLARIALSAGLAGVAAAAAAALVPGGAPLVRIVVGLVVVTLIYVIMMLVIREVHADERAAIRNALRVTKR